MGKVRNLWNRIKSLNLFSFSMDPNTAIMEMIIDMAKMEIRNINRSRRDKRSDQWRSVSESDKRVILILLSSYQIMGLLNKKDYERQFKTFFLDLIKEAANFQSENTKTDLTISMGSDFYISQGGENGVN